MTRTRLVQLSDAPTLTELLCHNRDFLAPSSPIRAEEFFTVDGQRAGIETVLDEHRQGSRLPHVILTEDGQVAGRITLNEIVRGPFQSCRMGYWVAAEHNGRGLATGAVRGIIRVAFEEVGLHRIEAGTLLHNVGSQPPQQRMTSLAGGPLGGGWLGGRSGAVAWHRKNAAMIRTPAMDRLRSTPTWSARKPTAGGPARKAR